MGIATDFDFRLSLIENWYKNRKCTSLEPYRNMFYKYLQYFILSSSLSSEYISGKELYRKIGMDIVGAVYFRALEDT